MEVLWITLGVIVLLVILWIIVSYHNYRNIMKTVENYINTYTNIQKKETLETDMVIKAELFQERINYSQRYPLFHDLYIGFLNDRKRTEKLLLKECFKYGFFYNFWMP